MTGPLISSTVGRRHRLVLTGWPKAGRSRGSSPSGHRNHGESWFTFSQELQNEWLHLPKVQFLPV